MSADSDQILPTDEEKAEISRLLRRIKPTSPVASLARSIISGTNNHPESIDVEVEALTYSGKLNWAERRVAAWSLGWANLDEPKSALAEEILSHVVRRGVPVDDNRAVRPLTLSLAIASLAGLFALAGIRADGTPILEAVAIAVPVMLLSLLLLSPPLIQAYVMYDDRRIAATRAIAVASLSRLKRAQNATTIAKSLFNQHGVVRLAAARAMMETLPLLSPDQYGAHDGDLVPTLCRLLRPYLEGWHLPVVLALGKIGDGRAIEPLDRLTRHCSTEVRQAVNEVLPILYERRKREDEARKLLRPSQAADETVLLRPHEGGPELETEALLRPLNSVIE